jgi:hypothetical protein
MGRTIEYRIENAGAPPEFERWTFAPIDEDTVTITTTKLDAAGHQVGEPSKDSAKWAELHEHGHFPRAATTISSESVTVPTGTFDAMKYVVSKKDSDVVQTIWFARTLPGPPVKLEVVKAGKLVMTLTMEANRAHP